MIKINLLRPKYSDLDAAFENFGKLLENHMEASKHIWWPPECETKEDYENMIGTPNRPIIQVIKMTKEQLKKLYPDPKTE